MKTLVTALLVVCLMTVSYQLMIPSEEEANSNSGRNKKPFRNRMLSDNDNNEDNNNNNKQKRPVMHTFFNQLQPHPQDERKVTAGMTANAHTDMIRVWEDAWQQAGWDTRILTMDDAKKHKDYNVWNPTIQKYKMGEYDQFCFYRWIAMAALDGGGWMSDYDTLPLNNFTDQGLELPNDGAFACYGNFVPALLSGNASEWFRMINLMVDYADTHTKDDATPSDMLTLLGMMEEDPNVFIARNEVLGSYDTRAPWTREACNRTTPASMRAMHFSHYFIHELWMPDHRDLTLDDRGTIASTWLDEWLAHCGRQQYVDPNAAASAAVAAVVSENKKDEN